MNRDIFCKNCRFYDNDPNFRYPVGKNTGTDVTTTCNCQYNIDTHYSRKDPRRFISTPSIINRCHDCMWFEKRIKVETFLWDHNLSFPKKYKPHGEGTFNVNPKNGIEGFYVGDKNLKQIISEGGSQDIQDLKEKVNKLESKTESNTNNITINKRNIDTLIPKVNSNTTKIEQLSSKINIMKPTVDKAKDLFDGKYIIDGNNNINQ